MVWTNSQIHSSVRRFSVSRFLVASVVAGSGCVPRLAPLSGAPAPAVLPRAELPVGHTKILFDWQLDDRELSGRGEGVARIAGPDSARLDLFLAGGFGSGAAVLIADSLQVTGGALARRLIPPPPLLWATLGRVAIPAVHDTVARVDGELLRVDIGMPASWRLTFRRDSLVRLERVRGGRII